MGDVFFTCAKDISDPHLWLARHLSGTLAKCETHAPETSEKHMAFIFFSFEGQCSLFPIDPTTKMIEKPTKIMTEIPWLLNRELFRSERFEGNSPKKEKHLAKRATEHSKHLKAMALIEQATKWIAAKLGS